VIAQYAAIATLAATVAIVAIAIFVSSERRPSETSSMAMARVYRVRFVYFILISAAVIVALAFTIPMTPYPFHFNKQKPDLVVKAIGEMWSWTLTSISDAAPANGNLVLPAGKLVEFDVTSKDVNHNFAIYNSAGELVAQVQAMPDYANHLFYRFDAPGHYYVLCLEYCGVAHHLMNTAFDVR
jgi:cytochrome c oxidase subunit 2